MVRSKISVWTLCLLFLAFVSPGKAADCPKPSPAGNVVLTTDAILKNHFPDGSDVTIECANGYVKDQGSDIITCTNGAWSEPQLICKKKDCGHPKPSSNLTYEMPHGTLFGARIIPVCDRGYFLQGSSTRQCLATGWSGRSRCQMVTCENPTEISNGTIIRRPEKDYPVFEDTVEYSCDPGYTLVGSKSIFCQADGEYSAPPPKCLAFECQAPHIQFAVQTKGESHTISKAIFKCQSGYRMKGSPTVVCEEHGWSELPVCIKGNLCPYIVHNISTTVHYLETTETTDTVFRVGISRSNTTTAPSDSRGVDYELPSSTVAGTGISGYTTEIAVVSVVFAAFLIIGLVCCLCYVFKRKGMQTRTAPAC